MKYLDKLKNMLKLDKNSKLFFIILLIAGLITGSLFLVVLNNADKTLVTEYIESFIENINSINYIDSLKNSLLLNYLTIIIIWIVGFSTFGFPINILITFWKSFLLGFIIASFIFACGIKGVLYSFIYIVPSSIINLFIFMILCSYSIKISFKIINIIFYKKETKLHLNRYLLILITSIIIITLTSLFEVFITPYLFKILIKLFS